AERDEWVLAHPWLLRSVNLSVHHEVPRWWCGALARSTGGLRGERPLPFLSLRLEVKTPFVTIRSRRRNLASEEGLIVDITAVLARSCDRRSTVISGLDALRYELEPQSRLERAHEPRGICAPPSAFHGGKLSKVPPWRRTDAPHSTLFIDAALEVSDKRPPQK